MTFAAPDAPLLGTVLAVQANFYRVQLDPCSALSSVDCAQLLCTRRARLKKLGQQVRVGDRVEIAEPDWMGQRGAIAQVLPRRSELERPPIANADQVLLIFAMADPVIDVYQLSRFLVSLERTGLTIIPCLSKADLVSPQEQQEWCDRLQTWGYTALTISVQTGAGLTRLQQQLSQRISVFAGPSGVGKSSLIQALAPSADLRVGAISEHWRKGKHTTRHVELFEMPQGGLLADTPGFSQPSLNCQPGELIHYFPEGRERLAQQTCQFKDCLHRDEPNCAVQGNWDRYSDYLSFLEEAIAYQQKQHRSRNPEAYLKTKHKQSGQLIYEPKLETKRYRQTSRRSQQQTLAHLYDEAQDP